VLRKNAVLNSKDVNPTHFNVAQTGTAPVLNNETCFCNDQNHLCVQSGGRDLIDRIDTQSLVDGALG
jgi:hypothetical protein